MSSSPTVIVANNMVMEAETAHVLQTCSMLSAFAALGGRVEYYWPDFGHTVSDLADLPIVHRPIRCRARHGAARYAEFASRLLATLARRGTGDGFVMTRTLGVAAAVQGVARRVVMELHQDFSPRARSLLVPFLSAQRLRWVTISGSLRDHLIGQYGFRGTDIIACHDAVEFPTFANAEPLPEAERPVPVGGGKPIHLYYGTLRPERGLALIRLAAEALPDHGFVLIGGRDDEVAAARAAGLNRDNVLVLSARPHAEIPRLVRSYDSVLLPYTAAVGTHRWMSPLKLFETLASGTPAVLSRLGPLEEVVDDSHVLFINPNRPETLIDALRHLAADPDGARRRARDAQTLVATRYTWTRRAADIIDLATRDLATRTGNTA